MSAPFRTTDEQIIRLAEIVTAMANAGLERGFIVHSDQLARVDQGAYDLMELWMDAESEQDRDEVIADLVEILEDYRQRKHEQKPYVRFDDLDHIAGNVREHKKRLRDLIDRHGGVSAVAKKTGLPQPSLSRMLNSASMPRRATLFRIAKALGVSETEIVGEWVQ